VFQLFQSKIPVSFEIFQFATIISDIIMNKFLMTLILKIKVKFVVKNIPKC